jgi:hypothetical protein
MISVEDFEIDEECLKMRISIPKNCQRMRGKIEKIVDRALAEIRLLIQEDGPKE